MKSIHEIWNGGLSTEVAKYRKGEKKIIRTHRPYLQEPWGGLLPGTCVVIGGHTSAGKSYEAELIIDEILDTNINKYAEDFVVLNFSLEMKVMSLYLRYMSRVTGYSKQELLLENWSEEKLKLLEPHTKKWASKNIYIEDNQLTADEWIDITNKFCEDNKNKKASIVIVDHMALLGEGNEITTSVNRVLSHINALKIKYDNVYFILLTQFSPSFFQRINDRDNKARPNERDTFYSGSLSMTSDYTVMIVNAQQLGIDKYLSLNQDRYSYLSKYFAKEEDVKLKKPSGKASFNTNGLLFYFLVKNREANRGYDDIFIKELTEYVPDDIPEYTPVIKLGRPKVTPADNGSPSIEMPF